MAYLIKGDVTVGRTLTAVTLVKSGGTSSQFLKADGSVDATAYTTNIGTVTNVAALTIGTTGTDLSSSVATSTTTPVITLNVPTASATNRGALSSTDWSTFNSKQAGGTYVGTIASADGSVTVTGTTAIDLAIVKAPILTTGRTIAITGDLAYTSPSFNGSTNVTAAGTLATVNSNVGSFTNASVTVNGKGLVTAASSGTAPVTSVSVVSPITTTGGVTPTLSTSMATNKLIGRGTAATGVMEEITLGTNLSLTGTTLNAASPTGAALTKADDTNVTLTLGGTPASSLLAATSLTLGWTGTLADGRIASSTNWNTAYTNRITSLTTTGSSGASTLASNVLNVPNYTLSGLGGVPYTGATAEVELGVRGITFDDGAGYGGMLRANVVSFKNAASANAYSLSMDNNFNLTYGATGRAVNTGTIVPLSVNNVYASNGNINVINGTGFVKATGTTISYDNSTYLTTATAASTYLQLAGGTLTGALTGTSATFTTGITNSAMTAGSVLFSGASGLMSQDNSNLFWDNTNKRLGIGTGSPNYKLQVYTAGVNHLGITGDNNANFVSQFVAGTSGYNQYRFQQSGGTIASPTALGGGYDIGNIIFQGRGTTAFQEVANIRVRNSDAISDASAPANMYFATTPSGSVTPIDRITILASGNVGIGNTSPSYKLDVNGTGNFSGALTGTRAIFSGNTGQVSSQSYFSSYTTDGLFNANALTSKVYTPSNNYTNFGYSDFGNGQYAPRIGFYAAYIGGGIQELTKASIGVEPITGDFTIRGGASNTEQLRIAQNNNVTLAGALTGTSATFSSNILLDNTQSLFWGYGDGTTSIIADATNPTGSLKIKTGNADRLTVLYNGNVGVGTSSPGGMLDVSKATVGDLNNIFLRNTDNTNAASGARIISQVGGSSSGDPRFVLSVTGVTEYNLGIDNSDSDKFKINSGSDPSAGANFLTIQTDGNVGIGMTNPQDKLGIVQAGGIAFQTTDATFNSGIGAQIYPVVQGSGNSHLYFKTNQGGSGGDVRMAILNNGNVGINTPSPNYKLDVNGTGNFSGALIGTSAAFSGSATATNFIGAGTGLTGTATALNIGGNAATATSFAGYTGNYNQTMTAVNTGGIIGFDNSVGYFRQLELGVVRNWIAALPLAGGTLTGALTGTSATFNSTVAMQGLTATTGNFSGALTTHGEQITIKTATDNNKQLIFGRTATDGRIIAVNQEVGYVPLLLQPDGGNVGINTTTPSYKLDVNGTGNFSGALTTQNIFPISDNGEQITIKTATDNNKQLIFGRTATDGRIIAVHQEVGYVPLLLQPHGGNVGVGTTSPTSVFDVRFANQVINNGSATGAAYFGTTDSMAINLGGSILLGGDAGGGSTKVAFGSISGRKENATSANYAGYLQFATNNAGGTVSERMRVSSDGNILINTTTNAGYKLDVTGTARFTSDVTATAFYQSSDLRLKNVISSIKSVDGINTTNFTLKSDGTEKWGYIAQEVEKVLPCAVSTDEKGMMNVDYTSILVYKIAQLEARIKELEK